MNSYLIQPLLFNILQFSTLNEGEGGGRSWIGSKSKKIDNQKSIYRQICRREYTASQSQINRQNILEQVKNYLLELVGQISFLSKCFSTYQVAIQIKQQLISDKRFSYDTLPVKKVYFAEISRFYLMQQLSVLNFLPPCTL